MCCAKLCHISSSIINDWTWQVLWKFWRCTYYINTNVLYISSLSAVRVSTDWCTFRYLSSHLSPCTAYVNYPLSPNPWLASDHMLATLLSPREISALSLSCQCHCCAENDPLPKQYLVSDGHTLSIYVHDMQSFLQNALSFWTENDGSIEQLRPKRQHWLCGWTENSVVSFQQLLRTITIELPQKKKALIRPYRHSVQSN